jgi:uncharacterized protein YbaP (TraB family)
VVILPDEEVSTSIGTLYSSSFGMTASVSVELQAPSITGTFSPRDASKEIVGLETLEFQLGIFDSLSRQSQQAMLEQTLAEIDEAETALAEMVDAWRDGELEELSAELLDDFDDFPGLHEALVAKRNRSWVPLLEAMLDDGRRHLVVVGALHLVGSDSVIDLLQARGHDVERLH